MSKDISEIKTELSVLKRSNNRSYYEYRIGSFSVVIYTERVREHPVRDEQDSITNHDKVDVYLFEPYRGDDTRFVENVLINLESDSRFKSYSSIKYREWAGYSTGVEMPIPYLCELIKYLHRLSKLSIFG